MNAYNLAFLCKRECFVVSVYRCISVYWTRASPVEGHVSIFVPAILLPWFRDVARRDFGLCDKFEMQTSSRPFEYCTKEMFSIFCNKGDCFKVNALEEVSQPKLCIYSSHRTYISISSALLGDDEATKVVVTSYPTQPTLSLRRIHFFRALRFLKLVTFQPEFELTLLRFFVLFFSTTKKIAVSLKIGHTCIFFYQIFIHE